MTYVDVEANSVEEARELAADVPESELMMNIEEYDVEETN